MSKYYISIIFFFQGSRAIFPKFIGFNDIILGEVSWNLENDRGTLNEH
jgi:hypothetical protein